MITKQEIFSASILIVDDQAANVQLLEQLLAGAGYTHVTATMQPEEVAALHRKNQYDLILLDLHMPKMDGFEVIRALKTNDPHDYFPVMVLTAQPMHKLQALQAGVRDFISKPFDLVEVKTRIHNMLEARLLYKKLQYSNKVLEQRVTERTAQLQASEERFRSLTELASDWYWEQDATGRFTKVSGCVLEVLGVSVDGLVEDKVVQAVQELGLEEEDESQRFLLQAKIKAKEPFLDFVFHRVNDDASKQTFRVSGEPMFDQACRLVGYRGVGVEVLPNT
jgi:PAS domain S-box-containing protein